MPLKKHKLETFDRSTQEGETLCGEPLFRVAARRYDLDHYAASRRVGAIIACAEVNFEPSPDACKRCVELWAKGVDLDRAKNRPLNPSP